jgi:hypothetical protein
MTIVTADSNTNASLIDGALEGISNASIVQSWGSSPTIIAPSSTAATFLAVDDWVPLTYQAADGSQAVLTLLAPQLGIFLADQVTVDPTAIAVLNGFVIGHLLTGTGQLVTTYQGGVRRKKLVDYG